jgi:hypothetical protein
MIVPTHGRVVWFTPASYDGGITQNDQSKPLAAIIVHVWNDRVVNLVVFDSNGVVHPRTSIWLRQDGDPIPAESYCEWMPFQKGQAAKTEQFEAAAQPK